MHTSGHVYFRRSLCAPHKGRDFKAIHLRNQLTHKSAPSRHTTERFQILMHIKSHGRIIHTPAIIGKLET